MTHAWLLGLLILLVTLSTASSNEEDFAFDATDDVEVEFDGEDGDETAKEEGLAVVGRAFRYSVPPFEETGYNIDHYEVKRPGGKGLPSWLLFDKKSGIFWGVPLHQDVGTLPLTVRTIYKDLMEPREEQLKIKVTEKEGKYMDGEKCEEGEDHTMLTLLLDRNLRTIKPKQRVVAVNNIAKFFGLPYSAFRLQPPQSLTTLTSSDDLNTDPSIILAGPGDSPTHPNLAGSALTVPVGCGGRLWVATGNLVKQLKEEARDGTVAEVLGVPVVGWRVKKVQPANEVEESGNLDRRKRAAEALPDDDYGASGDYGEEYYDDYEDYDGQDDLTGDVEKPPTNSKLSPSVSTSTVRTTSISTNTTMASNVQTLPDTDVIEEDEYEDEIEEEGEDVEVDKSGEGDAALPETSSTVSSRTGISSTESSTHAHRHHHGELNPSLSSSRDHHTTHKVTSSGHTPSTPYSSTGRTSTTTVSSSLPSSTTTIKKIEQKGPDYVLNYDDYGIDSYDEDYDRGEEDPIESKTIVPDYSSKKKQTVPPFEDTESITTEEATPKTTTKEVVISDTSPSTTSTSTSTATSSSTSTTATSTTASTTTLTSSSSTVTSATSGLTESSAATDSATSGSAVVYTESVASVTTSPAVHVTSTSFSEAPSVTVTQFGEDVVESEGTTIIDTERPTTLGETTIQQTVSYPTVFSSSTAPQILANSSTDSPTTSEETTFKSTTIRQVSPTSPSSTTTLRDVTEIDFSDNVEPFIENRLKQMSVTAGKIFRFVIPFNTFKDFEDEYNLTYELLDANNRSLTYSNNTWLHFNPYRREVYGLPLEEDVSKWVFWVQATDRDGASVREKLNIQVQQHKLNLIFNQEFSLHIRIEKHQEFPHYVDWSLKVLRALGKIYNTNMSEITVRKISHSQELVVFTWSNDSLPTNYCPKSDIEDLYKILTANDHGDPSRELNLSLQPELRVKKVSYRQYGVCEPPQTPVTQPMNFSPLLRNPVDHVNATVGELLIYKVKDDTFYDHEDVDPRMLNITLLTADRKPIPPDNWLQFDSKNREFFGIPRKAGRTDYQLVCIDSGGLEASDSLEVIVDLPAKRHYNVEFSMNVTTELPYQKFVNSAAMQKKFIEKLMHLFGEKTPNNFHLLPFKQTYDSIIITWFNKSLPLNVCPHEEIRRLQSVLHNMNDKSISHKVHAVMEPDFKVSTIKVHMLGNCKSKHLPPHEPRPESPPIEKHTPHSTVGRKLPPETPQEEHRPDVPPIEDSAPQSRSDEYLMTFIVPAVIISIMLFLASVAAIVLYRRRRMGKMNVEEDGRGSYGNKVMQRRYEPISGEGHFSESVSFGFVCKESR
ncbi:unnamed protein product [Acanthoscelides obtectus]|uniref:Dystroglycan 1 n=1 Tax=Acanthoscelides obtectus TaxID=200917 RepID=A0A9P0KMN9_ACAOB|nr:unnamed protein product [Acanthoscelides obtectus]CAK1641778.1 Dystroglycan [Acanthoscelides obtectus]